jgi:ketosteroid isomerase-like protein
MSTSRRTTSGYRRWPWVVTLMGSVAIGLLVAPGFAGAGTGAAKGRSDRVAATASEDLNLQRTWVRLFNGRRWDELNAIYEEDAIAIPPNHEPIRGRAAIIEYFKGIRDAVGEVTWGEPARITASGDLVALVGDQGSARSGMMRFNAHEVYARQPDGSLRYRFDMFGMQ